MHSHVHNEVLLEIIVPVSQALEHTITNSSILLVTFIPIKRTSHYITPTEQQNANDSRPQTKILYNTKPKCTLTQSECDKALKLMRWQIYDIILA